MNRWFSYYWLKLEGAEELMVMAISDESTLFYLNSCSIVALAKASCMNYLCEKLKLGLFTRF